MTGFRISADLSLPVEAITETFVVLAKRGKGKTYLASVMAEQMVGAGHTVVILDPVGVWWGLRSSADGQADGLPVVIFGGDHADVPLEPTAGELIADVLVDQRIPAVIDLSSLSKTKARSFTAAFLERLYHRNRDPLHVIVDEADAFAPQRATGEVARVLGAMEDLVRRGRARGIGVTLVTQRPAVLHKDVLTQAEVLIAMGMTGVRDVAAIDEWVRLHADDDEAVKVKKSLPSLPTGTAWVWSPSWLNILQRVKINRRQTYDSSATPKAGQPRPAPKRMAEIDLQSLGDQIAATVEKAKADDPRTLRVRISDLERQLAAERDNQPEPEIVEVPVLAPEIVDQLQGLLDPATTLLAELQETLSKHRAWAEQQLHKLPEGAKQGPSRQGVAPLTTRPDADRGSRSSGTPNTAETPAADGRDMRADRLPRAQRKLLAALAQNGTLTFVQLSLLSGYSAKSSGFTNALGALRSAGLAVGGRDAISATQDGIDALGTVEPLPTGPALVRHWMSNLSKAERALLGALLDVWPNPIDFYQLAEASGYSPTSSGFTNALGRLRTLQLASGGREAITAADELGEAAAS